VRKSLELTHLAYAHNLVSFPQDYFDLIIDNAAVFWYANPDEAEVLQKSFREMLRVVRPGGLIRIGDFKASAWKAQIIDNEAVVYQAISTPVAYGYEIKKL